MQQILSWSALSNLNFVIVSGRFATWSIYVISRICSMAMRNILISQRVKLKRSSKFISADALQILIHFNGFFPRKNYPHSFSLCPNQFHECWTILFVVFHRNSKPLRWIADGDLYVLFRKDMNWKPVSTFCCFWCRDS